MTFGRNSLGVVLVPGFGVTRRPLLPEREMNVTGRLRDKEAQFAGREPSRVGGTGAKNFCGVIW